MTCMDCVVGGDVFYVTLPETNSLHPKMDGWNTFSFPFGICLFSGANC